MFVKNDFPFFNVEESKKRSLEWKNLLGKDRVISSKIGYQQFWLEWLSKNNLKK